MMMSHFLSKSTNTCLPSAVFMLTVIERLLQLSIVKYRLSAFGTSRSCARVASPCGFSNLMTSAPIQASSCEQVGPACTCDISRIRTPFSASMSVNPNRGCRHSRESGNPAPLKTPDPRLRGDDLRRRHSRESGNPAPLKTLDPRLRGDDLRRRHSRESGNPAPLKTLDPRLRGDDLRRRHSRESG